MRVETEGHSEVRAAPPEGGADLTPSHLGQEMPHHSIFLNQINTHFPTQKSAKKYAHIRQLSELCKIFENLFLFFLLK